MGTNVGGVTTTHLVGHVALPGEGNAVAVSYHALIHTHTHTHTQESYHRTVSR